ncbi:MAG: hypothetical protein CL610_13080 [Anaerolineaceae bacterium]|nr:hypothetical protein [Anaerolineaceae bacterium]
MSQLPLPVTLPPDSPQIKRQLAFYSFQYIGIPLIFLLPLLAVLGVFGESFAVINATSADLALRVDYPTRYRYGLINDMEVIVRNLSDEPIPDLTVSFSVDYINQFAFVTFTPSAELLTGEVYEVELEAVLPGESRRVRVELQAQQYGLHSGTVSVRADSLEPVHVPVSTFVFP